MLLLRKSRAGLGANNSVRCYTVMTSTCERELLVKMKEEEDDRYKQFNERITNVERKILDMMKNMKSEVKLSKKNMS